MEVEQVRGGQFTHLIAYAVGAIFIFAVIIAGIMRFHPFFAPQYRSDHSQAETRHAFANFFQQFPAYKVPDHLSRYTDPSMFSANGPLTGASAVTVDSGSVFFYIPKKNLIIWMEYDNIRKLDDACNIILVGEIQPNRFWKYYSMMESDEKAAMWGLFSDEIASKLQIVKIETN